VSPRLALPLAAAGAVLAGLTLLGAFTLLLALSVVTGGSSASSPVALPAPAAATGRPDMRLPAPGARPSAFARADIPPGYLALYLAAGARFHLNWTILAGIGRVECDHGRDPAPSCTVEGQLNPAGAGGPAQFLVPTWQRYGISASGAGPPDMWNAADAIFSMANYLRACGAPRDYPDAIYCYNHAWWYVADVLSWARRYRG
jgi:hypothetical protein